MQLLPLIQVTHVTAQNGELTELGLVEDGRTIWRLPVATVKSLYHCGMRFFAKVQGKNVEVWVPPAPPHAGEPELRTKADSTGKRLLLTLPQFAVQPV